MGKILVIDDDTLVRNTIVRILARQGYQMLVAEDGGRGLRIFRAERPDLVITDIIMPEKEGLETIREILNECPDAKIIAISGGGRIRNMDFLEFAEKLGATEIIAKPFEPNDLLEMVSRCLDERVHPARV
jgi:DNA-binding NtrC family response regulator